MTIRVACSADSRYVPHVATMLKSLLVNARADVHVHVLLAEDVTWEQRAALTRMTAAHDAELTPIAAHGMLPSGLDTTEAFPAASWLRIMVPELLPEIDRILYLDSDIVVLEDLRPVFEVNLHGCLVGAVTNAYRHPEDFFRSLDVPSAESYFNAGVMLMDLVGMRQERAVSRIVDAARTYRSTFGDQDPLNAVLHDRRLPLPLRYNVQTEFYDQRLEDLVPNPAEVIEARENPAVLHYTAPQNRKPWHRLCRHPHRSEYTRYRRQTPWPKLALEGRSPKERLMHSYPQVAGRLSRLRRRILPRPTDNEARQ